MPDDPKKREELMRMVQLRRRVTELRATQSPSTPTQEQPFLDRVNTRLTQVRQDAPALLEKGAQQARQGQVLTGGLNIGNAIVREAFSPVTALGEVTKEVSKEGQNLPFPLNSLAQVPQAAFDRSSDLLSIAPWLAKKGAQAVSGITNELGLTNYPKTQQERESSQASSEMLGNLSMATVPQIAGRGMKAVPPAIGQTMRAIIPERLPLRIESASEQVPFSKRKGLTQVDRVANTGVKEDLSPSRGGIDKLQTTLDILNEQSKSRVVSKERMGEKTDLSVAKVEGWAQEMRDKTKNSAYKAEISTAIDEAVVRIREVADQYEGALVPPTAAWELKRSFQEMASKIYDQAAQPSEVKKSTHKAFAAKLLADITQGDPQLRQIGLKQRDLIEFSEVQQKRVAQLERQQPATWRTMADALLLAGGMLHPGSTVIGAADFIQRNPFVQHKTAVALDRLRNIGKK
jgi:hypothetical protein